MIPLEYFITVGVLLFLLGLYTCLTRVNAIGILIGIELMLNAAGLNFVAFAHTRGNNIDGHIMAIFIIVLAAAEAVVGLAVLLGIYRRFGVIDTSKTVELKE